MPIYKSDEEEIAALNAGITSSNVKYKSDEEELAAMNSGTSSVTDSSMLDSIKGMADFSWDKIQKAVSNSVYLDIPPGEAYKFHEHIEEEKKIRGIDIQKLKGISTLKKPEGTTSEGIQPSTTPFGIAVEQYLLAPLAGIGETYNAFVTGAVVMPASILAGAGTAFTQILDKPEKAFLYLGETYNAIKEGHLPEEPFFNWVKINESAQSIVRDFQYQPQTISGQQLTGLVMKPIMDTRENVINLSDTPEGKDRNAFLFDTAFLLAPLLWKGGKSGLNAVKNSDLYRELTIKERGIVIQTAEGLGQVYDISTLKEMGMPAETLLKAGYEPEALFNNGYKTEISRLFPEFKERAIKERGLNKNDTIVMPPDVKAVYEGVTDGFMAKGADVETARGKAMEAILRTESGQKYVKSVVDIVDEAKAHEKEAQPTPKAEEPFVKEPTTKDRKSTRLNSSHIQKSRMPSSA